jgi:Lysine methyltransferase
VLKLLNQNLVENQQDSSSSTKSQKNAVKSKRGSAVVKQSSNITARPLDWETDMVTPSLTGSESNTSFDAVIACDCIYNDALIDPLVQTCIDVCRLRKCEENDRPTVCIVAQQLRSAEVFEGWLKAFYKAFRAWRIPDEELVDGLKSNSGFVIHVGILR